MRPRPEPFNKTILNIKVFYLDDTVENFTPSEFIKRFAATIITSIKAGRY